MLEPLENESGENSNILQRSMGAVTQQKSEFMLGEDRLIPQVCVSLIDRATGDVIRNDIPAPENTQQFGSASCSKKVFTQRTATEGRENICTVQPVMVDHVDVGEPQFDDVFGCRFEMNDGRHVEGVSCTGADMPGTSEVRHNVSADDSDNTTTWVIPGADSYSFGIGRITTLVAEEPTSMIYKGQLFPTKKDLKRLVGLFAMQRNFEWKVKRSNKTTLHLVCFIDNCTWKLRAVRRDEETYFQVRSFVNEHSCPLEEIHRRHRQASAVIIGEVVAPRLQQQDGRLMRPKDIIADMKTMYGIQIMYSKAHQALHYALSLTYGTHEETFQLLPSFGYVLEQQNPGTITDLQCADDVDGTHLKGRFGGTMFVAIAQNGNEQVKDVAAIMDKVARAYTEFKYNRYMGELRNLHKNAFDYVEAAGPYKWSRVHCPQLRFRVMTTNVAECINSCLKFARQLPMLTLAEFIRNMLQRWFHDRHRAAQSMHRHQLTDASHLVMLQRVEKCGYMTVNPVDWNIFSVKRERNLDFTSLCSDYYKRQTFIDAYSVPIMSVCHPSSWVVSSDIAEPVVLNPKTKRQSGRPMEG
ncbi:hypothetical protein Dsin_032349 [Dipteronia sinensis]|uniref:Transposase MuDR plant domain-containing protein n=1 Tax=Dipteronia sinensis TaxID=43782 RepID=A0AAD9ZMX3_9ROSI|nr:hypothetical protein Dsin_032349 [Dipteronia sinensis]